MTTQQEISIKVNRLAKQVMNEEKYNWFTQQSVEARLATITTLAAMGGESEVFQMCKQMWMAL